MLEYIIASIAPHTCLLCGKEPNPLCDLCISILPTAPECCYKCGKTGQKGICMECKTQSALESITVRTLYSDPVVKDILHKLKFGRVKALAKPIAFGMAAYRPEGVITHVPTAPSRIRQRGYDQAQYMAKNLARQTGHQYKNMFIRTSSKRQLGQTRQVRQQQLRDVFQLRNNLPSYDTPIILVDDVLTTGSTVEAAAHVLRHAGYQEIHAQVFAWAPPSKVRAP